MLPYAVKYLKCTTLYETNAAHGREDDLDKYKALLHPNVISNLKMEELEGNAMVMASVTAPNIHIRLPQEDNHSSLRYTLPPPDPSSLADRLGIRGAAVPAAATIRPSTTRGRNHYVFRPVVEEGKEGEPVQLTAVAQGEGVVARRPLTASWTRRASGATASPTLSSAQTSGRPNQQSADEHRHRRSPAEHTSRSTRPAKRREQRINADR